MRNLWSVPVLAILLVGILASCGSDRRAIVLETAEIINDPELAHPEKLGKIRPGDEVKVLEEKTFGEEKFVQIQISEEETGWVKPSALKISDKKGALAVNGFAIIPAIVVDNPAAEKPRLVTRLSRGETFKVIQDKEFNEVPYVQVGISGIDEVAWVKKEDIFIGDKVVITAMNDTDIYDRPDKNRRPIGKLPAGKRGYQVDEDGDFVRFNVWKGQEHWVLKSSVGEGDVKVNPTVAIQGFGKATLDATSWVDSDVEGRENVYSPTQAFDSSFSTSWQVNKNGGVGESLTILFADSVPYVGVQLVNGFAKSEELYNQNNRVTALRLTCIQHEFSSDKEVHLSDDVMDYQSAGYCESVTGIRLTITGVAKGSRWQDAAISEIQLNGGP